MKKQDLERIKKLEKKWIASNLENKYKLFSSISIKENSLNIFNKNNNNFLLISIIPNEKNNFRVYTDDNYLVINSYDMIEFLIKYLNDYFLF